MTAPHFHSHVDDPAAVGRRLREARVTAGFSQRQLSFPGCSAAYISRLEAGERVPSLQLLRKLALKLDADDQYLATGIARIEQAPPELVDAEVERRLAGEWDRPPEENRPSGGLAEPADRARILWDHSRSLLRKGDRRAAASYARDALALLEYADDRARTGT
jgi:transcriptional regulator with XRE-family HTH domain